MGENKPTVYTIIPARGGSQRIQRKNLRELGGLPLVVHSILHARGSKLVNEVFVSTEDDEIASVSEKYGAKIVQRPASLAGPTASSESALLHAIRAIEGAGYRRAEILVFLQCTSPVRRPDDIDKAVEKLLDGNLDSVFSACEHYGLFWRLKKGEIIPVNYDPKLRKREQDMEVQYLENGSIFVMRTDVLLREECRMCGKIGIYEMDKLASFQVDEPDDLVLLEMILAMPEYKTRAV